VIKHMTDVLVGMINTRRADETDRPFGLPPRLLRQAPGESDRDFSIDVWWIASFG